MLRTDDRTTGDSDRRRERRRAVGVVLVSVVCVACLVFATRSAQLGPRNSVSGVADGFEYKIGEFREGNDSLPGRPLLVDMTLYAEVAQLEAIEIPRLVEAHGGRIREAVSGTLRSARVADLMEPSLTTLKRKMKVALAEATGRDAQAFDRILIPDYDLHRIQ
jgi:hypothetical protein